MCYVCVCILDLVNVLIDWMALVPRLPPLPFSLSLSFPAPFPFPPPPNPVFSTCGPRLRPYRRQDELKVSPEAKVSFASLIFNPE